jgi:hypothetical protein
VDSLGFSDVCPWVLRDIGATRNKTNDFLFEGLKQGNAFPYPKQW